MSRLAQVIACVSVFVMAITALNYGSIHAAAQGDQGPSGPMDSSLSIVDIMQPNNTSINTSDSSALSALLNLNISGDAAARHDMILVSASGTSSGEFIAGALEAAGIDVVEVYDSFAMASVTSDERAAISLAGLNIADMNDRTMTGRGSYFFDTRGGEPDLPSEMTVDPAQSSLFIVQFIGPIKTEWLDELSLKGVHVLDYLPEYSFVVSGGFSVMANLSCLPYVQWVGVYQPAYKISPTMNGSEDRNTDFVVSMTPDASLSRLLSLLSICGGSARSCWKLNAGISVEISAPYSAVAEIARLPDTLWIENKPPTFLMNDQATWVLQSDSNGVRSIYDHGITGTNQIITMADTGLNTNHEMFSQPGKVVAYWSAANLGPGGQGDFNDEAPVGHGTHVAGTAVGDAPTGTPPQYGTYNLHDGNAIGSKIIVEDMCVSDYDPFVYPPSDLTNLFTPSYAAGSRISTNSWGASYDFTYSQACEEIDSFMWSHQDYLILFAAGNHDYYYDIYSGSLSSEATAKDIVTVGASANGAGANDLASVGGLFYSSRGPTSDGRIKPTVMAPGQGVNSSKWDTTNGYWELDGTSMATPAVAGCAALIRQYFLNGYYPSGSAVSTNSFVPSAALTKAMLIDGTSEMTGAEAYGQTVTNEYSLVEASNVVTPPSQPYSLHLMKTDDDPNNDANGVPNSATSPFVSLTYSSVYHLGMSFYFPASSQADRCGLLYDGCAYAKFTNPSGAPTAALDFSDSLSHHVFLNGITTGQWHYLQIDYNPSAQTYTAWVDTSSNSITQNYYGPPVGRITLGNFLGGPVWILGDKDYGEVYVDDVRYWDATGWNYLNENFDDGVVSDWIIQAGPTKDLRFPNYDQGWGRVNLENSLYFSGDQRKLVVYDEKRGLSTGFVQRFSVAVNSNSCPLNVALVWTDYPGSPGASNALVDDLDLTVIDPQGNIYRGNVFGGYNPGQSVTGGSYDHLNVEEGVRRLTPIVGTWQISVTGACVPQEAQPFALVVTGDVTDRTSVLFQDDFSENDVCEWSVLGTDVNGHVQTAIHKGQKYTPCMDITRSSGSNVWIAANHSFRPVTSGRMMAQANLMVSSNANSKWCYFMLKGDTSFRVYFGMIDGYWKYYTSSGWVSTGVRYSAGVWYHVLIDANLTASTYNIYVEGNKINTLAAPFYSSGSVDNVWLQAGNSAYKSVTLWADEVVIRKGQLRFLDDFQDQVISDWTTGGSTVSIDTKGDDHYLKLTRGSSMGGDMPFAWHTIPTTSNGHLIAEAKCMINTTDFCKWCYFMLKTGNNFEVYLVFNWGVFAFYTPNGWVYTTVSYLPEYWYRVYFDIDLTAGTYDCYVDGSLIKAQVACDFAGPHAIDKIWFQAGAVNMNYVTMWVDDVLVYLAVT